MSVTERIINGMKGLPGISTESILANLFENWPIYYRYTIMGLLPPLISLLVDTPMKGVVFKWCVCVVMYTAYIKGSKIVSVPAFHRTDWHDTKIQCVTVVSVSVIGVVMYYFREEKLYNVYMLTLPEAWDSSYGNLMWFLYSTELCTMHASLTMEAVVALVMPDNQLKFWQTLFIRRLQETLRQIMAITLWHHFLLERLWWTLAVFLLVFYYLYKLVFCIDVLISIGSIILIIVRGDQHALTDITSVIQ